MTLRVRTRLTLWHLAVLGVILAAFAAFMYLRLAHQLHAGIDADLRLQSGAILQRVRSDPGFTLSSLHPVRGTEETFVQILGRDRSVLDHTTDSPEAAVVPPGPASGLSTVAVRGEDAALRVLVTSLPAGRRLVVGASLQPASDALRDFLVVALLGGAAALALAGAGGWLLAKLALQPVERMRLEAEAVGASEPSRRLPAPVRDDEIGRLARTLNEMLDRLETGLNRERAFVAEASHDLRTPVAILKSEVELALQGDRSPEDLRAALRSVGEEADRLAALAEDLLFLAGARDSAASDVASPIELGDLVSGSVRRFRPLAHQSGIGIEDTVNGELPITGDRARIARTVDNLIDNAVRNSPRGSTVEVETTARGDSAIVEVRDRGPGVPPDLGARLFEPFQRGPARYPGVGLGLAIARTVTQAHGGTIEFEPRAGGGSTFRMVLPIARGAPSREAHLNDHS